MAKRKKKDDHPTEASERWLLTYADMITLLLGIFIILMSTRAPGEENYTENAEAFSDYFSIVRGGGGKTSVEGKGGSKMGSDRSALIVGHKEPPSPMATVEQRFKMTFPFEVKKGEMKIHPTRDALIVRFSESALFDSGKADIKSKAYKTLDNTGALLESIPNRFAIEGHTDAKPINTERFPSNWELSLTRAMNVLHYLYTCAQKRGVLSDKELFYYQKRMSVYGYAQFRPINPDPYSADNRRVDIVIYHRNIKEKDLLFEEKEEE